MKSLGLIVLLALASSFPASAQSLSIGDASANGIESGITISAATPLSGGSGSGYSYQIYRDTQPLVSISTTPLASVATLPYTDTTAAPGVLYFYKLVGKDSAGGVAFAAPAGLNGIDSSTDTDLSMAAERPTASINIVYGGDSITYGANLSDPSTQAPPVTASACLRAMYGIRAVHFSNQGHGGHTTTDFLPSSNGDFQAMENAARNLQSAAPDAQLVFSLMLGTNDSATAGTNQAARTPEQITANYETIVGQLLTDFPNAKVFINYAPWYSPNTHNGANYEAAGLARLMSYIPAIDKAVADENRKHRGHVKVGDTTAPAFFASVYQTELTPENGRDGTFFLHPNKVGAADLGRLWAEAIYRGLFGAVAR